jgi:hypothetical protein
LDPPQVQPIVLRWRTEANDAREKVGLTKVYLMEHKAAAQASAAAAAAAGGSGCVPTSACGLVARV